MKPTIVLYIIAAMGVVFAAMLLVAGQIGARADQHRSAARMESLGPAPSFELTSHRGRSFGFRDLAGKVWVADFFFSSCPGVCPIMKENLSRVLAAIRSDDFLVVSISVDPDTDTPEHLAEYADNMGAGPNWFFLTGPQSYVSKLAREGFKLGATEVPGEVLHSDRFVLVDRGGQIRGYYRGTEPAEVERLIRDARELLGE